MNLDKNQTIEEIMSFKKPKSVYAQLYSATTKGGRQLCDKLGIFPSLIFSLVVVVLVSWGLSSLETALNLSNENGGADLKKVEQNITSKINWSTIARKVLGVEVVHAADPDIPEVVVKDEAYHARYVSQSIPDPVEIEAGSTRTVTFKFKNVGNATWNSTGSRFISAFTMDPRYRASDFRGANWVDNKQTARMSGVVKPGEIGELKIDLKAPDKVGEYTEKFYLAAENYSWMKGGYFFIKIKVVSKKVVSSKPVEVLSDMVPTKTGNNNYEAKQLILTQKSVTAIGGQRIKVIIGYQNLGTAAWGKFTLSTENNGIEDSTWLDGSIIFSEDEEIVPGGFLRKTFYFYTPQKEGNYSAEFKLNIDEGGLVEKIIIPIEVTADALSDYKPLNSGSVGDVVLPANQVKENIRLAEEPRVRVGIVAPDSNFLQFRSYDDDYNVYVGSEKQGVLKSKQFAVLKFEDGKYFFDGGGINFEGVDYIRLEPINDKHAVFYLPNLVSRTAAWVNPSKKFNRYRGALEYRQGQVDKKMYIVNDLLIEDYIKGMAEMSSAAPIEFVKANLVAARNYVYFAKNKYPFFDVLGNTYDQLYLGFEAEESLPNVVLAAEATRGVFVTYGGEVVTTPYFGNSNGYTKSWSSVWGGSVKPWLVPVMANYDAGRSMLGHGVGMSQRDAALRADKEGANFVELLKYYYTGVEVEKLFN